MTVKMENVSEVPEAHGVIGTQNFIIIDYFFVVIIKSVMLNTASTFVFYLSTFNWEFVLNHTEKEEPNLGQRDKD